MPEAIGSDEAVAHLTQLALQAGRAILDVYAGEISAELKADASPVTEADRRAEKIILDGLKKVMPDIPVIAEEEVSAGRMPATSGDFILVDPLDGTKEFLSRNGEFTVNIALVRGGVPILGVVYAPALGKIYAGGPGGAFAGKVSDHAMDSQRKIGVRAAGSPILAIGSRSHGSAETEAWLKRYGDVSFVAAGSSLKFCLVAEGAADVYPRLGRTMEWDTAAGDAVLRAAGGLVTTLDGAPLTYGKRVQKSDSAYANPFFVAFGDRRLASAGQPESSMVSA
jgi:3'(2'),5'-bisphosphate nucleotidase